MKHLVNELRQLRRVEGLLEGCVGALSASFFCPISQWFSADNDADTVRTLFSHGCHQSETITIDEMPIDNQDVDGLVTEE